jgi:hypothetical protein
VFTSIEDDLTDVWTKFGAVWLRDGDAVRCFLHDMYGSGRFLPRRMISLFRVVTPETSRLPRRRARRAHADAVPLTYRTNRYRSNERFRARQNALSRRRHGVELRAQCLCTHI